MSGRFHVICSNMASLSEPGSSDRDRSYPNQATRLLSRPQAYTPRTPVHVFIFGSSASSTPPSFPSAETNPSSGCGWAVAEDPLTGYKNETAAGSNCAYLSELISALRAKGAVVGTYTSAYMWSSIMGSSCTAGSSTPL